MQPQGSTRTTAFLAAVWRRNSIAPAVSAGGLVFGIATTEVKPPAAAAAVPEAMVSAILLPGWRRCTCRSMKPGLSTLPPRSITSPPRTSEASAMRPSITPTSPLESILRTGSITRAFLKIKLLIFSHTPLPGRGPPCGPPTRSLPVRESRNSDRPPLRWSVRHRG